MTASQFDKRLTKLVTDAVNSGVSPAEIIKMIEMRKLILFVDCHMAVRGMQVREQLKAMIQGN